jgi:peptide/nickel transport system substrate-binding protein
MLAYCMWSRTLCFAALDAPDAKTIVLKLKEPYGLVLESIGKPSSYVPFMMPKRLAETPPGKPIPEQIGSGPFKFVQAEFQPGVKAVYEMNTDYVPRQEPPSWTAGGKVWQCPPVLASGADACR